MTEFSSGELVFWISLGLMAFAYIGYPLLLVVLERIFYLPINDRPQTPKVTLLMCVHNEEATLAAKLDNLLALDYPKEMLAIVVASDGSTDLSVEIVKGYASKGVVLHEHIERRGKAAVLNDEVPLCQTDLVALVDARQLLAADALRNLMANFADHAVGAASGELVIGSPTGTGAVGKGMGAYWKYEKFIRLRESAIYSSVGATGAFLAFRRSLWRGLPARTIVDDMVLPFQIVNQGYRVVLEPRALVYDKPSTGWMQEFSRKTRTLAGNFQILSNYRLMGPALFGPISFQFFCHKVLRLLGPLLLIAMFLGAYRAHQEALLENNPRWSMVYGLALAGQGFAYSLALLGALADAISLRLPLIHIPYTFLLTQVAVCCGFMRFGSGRDDSAWEKASRIDPSSARQRFLRLLFDSALFCSGFLVAGYVRYGSTPPASFHQAFEGINPVFWFYGYSLPLPLIVLVPLSIFYFFRLNERPARAVNPEQALEIFKANFYATMVVMLVVYKLRGTLLVVTTGGLPGEVSVGLPTSVFLISFLFSALCMMGWRFAWQIIHLRLVPIDSESRKAALACGGIVPRDLLNCLDMGPSKGCQLTGYMGPVQSLDIPRLEDEEKALESLSGGELLVAAGSLSTAKVLEILDKADRGNVTCTIISSDLEFLLASARLSLKSYIPVLALMPRRDSEWLQLFKRICDLFVGSMLMLSGLPAYVMAIFRRGPRFRLVRLAGRDGAIFELLRPVAGMRRRIRHGLSRFGVGWAMCRGDLALIGPQALKASLVENATPLEKRVLWPKPGIWGPRRLHFSGASHISRRYWPWLAYCACYSFATEVKCIFGKLNLTRGVQDK